LVRNPVNCNRLHQRLSHSSAIASNWGFDNRVHQLCTTCAPAFPPKNQRRFEAFPFTSLTLHLDRQFDKGATSDLTARPGRRSSDQSSGCPYAKWVDAHGLITKVGLDYFVTTLRGRAGGSRSTSRPQMAAVKTGRLRKRHRVGLMRTGWRAAHGTTGIMLPRSDPKTQRR
jgi:hypothetical protein